MKLEQEFAMIPLVCEGFTAAGVSAGIKTNGEPDLGLLVSDRPAQVAAVFTKNRVQAAPVVLDKRNVRSGTAQAVIVNSGNANCANGPQGMDAAEAMSIAAAKALNLPKEEVLVASTGVIGVPFPIRTVEKALPGLVQRLKKKGLPELARAIMTTDTRPKIACREGSAGGGSYRLMAVAKGAGMIRPDMATMLCFVLTDAEVYCKDLQAVLKKSVDASFNRITIDGDTSTNDTVILMANGATAVRIQTAEEKENFQRLLDDLCLDLARQMVKDGEGVTKVVDVSVRGARSDADARSIADTISNSPLVKTAFFGEDANWGRIVGAAGRAGVFLDPDLLDLYFDDVQMVKDGTSSGGIAEENATAVLKKPEFSVTLDLKLGKGTAHMITCDFSIDYVKINADYRS